MGKRKRKGTSEISETLISGRVEDEGDNDETVREEEREKGGGGFFACYLLTSLSPRHKGHTYIGFTVNPRRRIRQHNGEMRCGAWRTKTKRPWEMVLCIYGFPTNVSALQFEWAWQHPTESLAVRKAAANFKTFGGIANKVKLAFTMLTLPTWQSLDLTVNYFSTKYTKFSAGCPKLPEHMNVQVSSMDELPCYTGIHQSVHENEDDFNDEEECEEAVNERLTDTTVQNYVDHQRKQDCYSNSTVQVSSSPSSLDRDMFDPEDQSQTQSRQVSSSYFTSSADALETTVDRDSFACENEPPSMSLSVPHEVEIIDVLSPSPSYRISSHSKKRRVSSVVCPEIIDLTKSPIFV